MLPAVLYAPVTICLLFFVAHLPSYRLDIHLQFYIRKKPWHAPLDR